MRFLQKSATSRRRRIAALLGVSGMLTYSVASAQADGDWLETALEETLRLSSPWELPIMPQLDPSRVPDAAPFGPDAPAETKIVLEVPWGSPLETGAPQAPVATDRLVVRLVDEFEDPWLSSDEGEPSASAREPSEQAPDPRGQSSETRRAIVPAASSSPSEERAPELIDPWAD